MKNVLMPRKWIIFSVFIFLLLICIYYQFSLIENITFYETDVYISDADNFGFNLDSDKLHFGLVPLDAEGGYRKIEITNPYAEKVTINVFSTGDIASYLSYMYEGKEYENTLHFSLLKNETKSVKIIFKPEVTMNIGDYYSGKIFILVRKQSFVEFLHSKMLESFL